MTDLYQIIRNMIMYCKYALKFSVFEVIYFTFLWYIFLPIHSSFLTYKGHMRDTLSLEILVSPLDL